MQGSSRQEIEAVLATAARAPSAHNTQPWIVRAAPARISVRADPARWLRHGDPTRRDLHLALGGFIEAVRIACAAHGLCAEPDAVRDGEGDAALALRRGGAATPEDRLAVSLLRRRGCSRLPYAKREPDTGTLAALAQAARGAGLDLHLLSRAAPERRDLDGWHHAAARESWLDGRAVAELGAWLRIDPEGALRPEDGLSSHCLGLGWSETAALAALVRPGLWRAAHAAYLAPLLAGRLAEAETRPFAAAPLGGVLIAPADAGACGGALLRFWLAVTRLGLAMVPASAIVDRRGWELGRRLGVPPGRLVAVFRLGRSAPAPRSGRRAVARFASLADAPAPAGDDRSTLGDDHGIAVA
jgi:nitroreductase